MFHRIGVSTSITFFGKCWFLVYQPTWLWLQSWPVSGFFWCLVGQLLARQLSNIISYFLASASSASLTHRELTTPTLCRTARSTSLTEAKSKTRESFSFSFVGKAFYSISQLLEQNSKRQWVRRLMTKIIWFVGSSRIWCWVQIWVGFISPSLSHLKVSIQPKEATQLLICCQWGQAGTPERVIHPNGLSSVGVRWIALWSCFVMPLPNTLQNMMIADWC